jgi:amidase
MAHLFFSTASELARKIRAGDVSAIELVEAHLSRIRDRNVVLNAVVTLDAERARQRAREADRALAAGEDCGPLHGVPVTVKDSIETEGLRTTSSTRSLVGHVPRRDASVVSRLRAAGAIILGKTNLPELAMDMQTDSPVFGRANNPWNVERTTGGSTGGGAAAVAAGLSPLEIGSDLAGSIRVPAHYCGVFGLKPTEHLVPTAGHIPEPPGAPRGVRHAAVIGPLARSIEDLRLALSVMAGPDGRDWAVPPVSCGEAPARSPGELRLAWTKGFGGVPVGAETREAMGCLAQALQGAGCTVAQVDPAGFNMDLAWRTYGRMVGAEIGASMPAAFRMLAPVIAQTVYRGDLIGHALMRGMRSSCHDHARALTSRDELIGCLERFLDDWDAWLCPVTVGPAFTHRMSGVGRRTPPIEVDGQPVPYWMATTAHTVVFSLTGSPVVVLPLARSREGLPIGVQIVGRRWRDMELLAVAQRVSDVIDGIGAPPEADVDRSGPAGGADRANAPSPWPSPPRGEGIRWVVRASPHRRPG